MSPEHSIVFSIVVGKALTCFSCSLYSVVAYFPGKHELVYISLGNLHCRFVDINLFLDFQDLDIYDFKVVFMKIYLDDNVPEPEIIRAALYACRRMNDLAMAMRVLEMTRVKVDLHFFK